MPTISNSLALGPKHARSPFRVFDKSMSFRKASNYGVKGMRASGEKCAFSCGLHWDLYLLCFDRPHHLQTSVRCVPAIWSRIPQSTKKYPSRHPAGVETPQSGQLPSLAFPAQTLATPTASVLRSTTGGGTPGCMPLWHEPQARNSPRTAWTLRPGSTKMTPKTHHGLRPEAAGSRHSLLHLRETNR